MVSSEQKAKIKILYSFVLGLFLCVGAYSSNGLRDSLRISFTNEVGIRELTGNNDGERVEAYLSTCNLGKGYAWCAAFVNWNFIKAGIETGVKSTAWSPSWFADTSKVVYTKNWTRDIFKVKAGQVFGLYFYSKRRVAHVGFIEYEDVQNYYTVEGNTNKAGSREGDGVYRRVRPKNTIYIISDYVREETKYNEKTDWRKQSIYNQSLTGTGSKSLVGKWREIQNIWSWFIPN